MPLVLTLALSLMCSACASDKEFWWNEPPGPQGSVYVVFHEGDSLTDIAGHHHVSEAMLVSYNGLSATKPKDGAFIFIPPASYREGDEAPELETTTAVAQAQPEPVPLEAQEPPAAWVNPLEKKEPVLEQAAPAHEKAPVLFEVQEKLKYKEKPTWIWPVSGTLLEHFGPTTKGEKNEGITLSAPLSTPVKAARDGVVIYVGHGVDGYGELILVKHEQHFETAYAHVQKILVKSGDKVKQGQTIALVGQKGNATQPQLYFEVRQGLTAVDPLGLLKVQKGAATSKRRKVSAKVPGNAHQSSKSSL